MKDKLAITFLSASRPDYLFRTVETLMQMNSINDYKMYLHEDVLDAKKSRQVLAWSEAEGHFAETVKHDPPVGAGEGARWLLENCNADYILFMEDDWVCYKPLPLAEIIELMDIHKGVNQICFNKRKTMSSRGDWIKKELIFGEQRLVTNPHWTFNPAVWRVDWILEQYPPLITSHVPVWQINKWIKMRRGLERTTEIDADWVIGNSGTYFWGPIRQKPFLAHIGNESARVGRIHHEDFKESYDL